MSERPRIILQWTRFLPYQFARLEAARRALGAQGIDVVGVETAWRETVYSSFSRTDECQGFRRLFTDASAEVSNAEMGAAIHRSFSELAPSAVVVNGYGLPDSLACLLWCLQTSTPAIVMSDSWERDFRRVQWREWLKSLIVRQFDAAYVAGTYHRAYIQTLGIPLSRVISGYDVVDNDYFATGARVARQNRHSLALKLGLPERYLLASGRFVERKNFERLLDAYEIYRQKAGTEAWDLVLVGEGPLMERLRPRAERPGLAGHVHLPGFVEYGDLPNYYGLADAYICPSVTDPWALVVNEAMASGLPVLVSECCGCVADLVREGKNGFSFDPLDAGSIAGAIAALFEADLAAMGEESQRIIQNFSPQTFAEGLLSAYRVVSGETKSAGSTLIGKALVKLCMHAPVRYETFS